MTLKKKTAEFKMKNKKTNIMLCSFNQISVNAYQNHF